MDRFIAEDWQKLTPEERALRCRVMAKEAMTLAITSPKLATFYIDIAEDWLELAAEFDQSPDLPK